MDGLNQRAVFKPVDRHGVLPDEIVVGVRFFLSLEEADSSKTTSKERFLFLSFKYKKRGVLTRISAHVRTSSGPLLVILARVLLLQPWGFDVTKAYLRSDTELDRNVDIVPPLEVKLESVKLLRTVKSLEELTERGTIRTKR